jgi:hypothetical protein
VNEIDAKPRWYRHILEDSSIDVKEIPVQDSNQADRKDRNESGWEELSEESVGNEDTDTPLSMCSLAIEAGRD